MDKILVSVSYFDTLGREAWNLLEENGYDIIYNPEKNFPSYTTEEIEELPDREEITAALVGMDDYRDERKYQLLPNLRIVTKFGVGVDNIDGELAKKYGVKICNAPGQNANAVAELTVCFILNLLRSVPFKQKEMEEGIWDRSQRYEIKGKIIGLLGFGSIAKLVAKKLQAWDVKVIACDLFPDKKTAAELGVRMTTQEEVITTSDFVSIHIPAAPETYHLFDEKKINAMKDGVYLLNLARGALVDLNALANALNSGKLAGAGLDVFEVEPLPADAEIFKCKNVVVTPHVGAETFEAYHNVSMTTALDFVRVIKGENPIHWVNR